MKSLTLLAALLFAPLLRAQTTVQIPYNGTMPVSVTTSGCPGGATVTQPSPTHVNVDASKCQGGPPPVLTVYCNPSSISTAQTSQCTASQPVTWKASSGSISTSGLFTPSQAGSVTVAGTTTATPTQIAQTTVQVNSISACNSQYTIKPTGGVDNSTWLSVIAAAKGARIEVCTGNYNLQPLSFANANLALDDDVTVNDTAGYGTYQRMLNIGSNVTIAAVGPNKSAGFTMPFSYASNIGNGNQDTNQYKHCIFPDGNAVNVVLADFWTTKCGGDGISVNNANVTINNVTSSGNIRNGLSFTGAGTSTVNGGNFKGNVNFSKAGIADGIDAEMNAPGTVQHLTFNNVTTNGNGQDGVCLCIGQLSSNPSNSSTYVFNGHTSSGNGSVPPPSGLHGGAPYRFRGWASNWQGSIKVNNSTANGQPFSYSYPPQGPINPN